MTREFLDARGLCPKGEHRTFTVPVTCEPNKESPLILDLPSYVGDVAGPLIVAALLIAGVGQAVGSWWRRRALRREATESDNAPLMLTLGTVENSPGIGAGDLGWRSWSLGALLPLVALRRHVLIVGGTGAGKSTTVERIELEAVRTYRPQVVHFDCKGRTTGAARFLALMLGAGYEDDEIRVAPLECYDGWRGDERAHVNRLLAIQDFSEAQPYYTAATKDLIQQIIAGGLPRFSHDVTKSLGREHDDIDPKVITGTRARYRGFFNGVSGLLDGSWAFDDVAACYVELPGMARREDAIAFGRYLLEDFMHYIAERKPPDREVLLVLDDFSAISRGDEAVNLMERAREFNVAVVLTTQSYSGLGPDGDRIIDACNGAVMVHRLSNPHPFIHRAGTIWRRVAAETVPTNTGWMDVLFPPRGGLAKPSVTYRDEEFPRIDPNEARSLPTGQVFLIAGGRAQRVRINPMSDLTHEAEVPLIGKTSLVALAGANLRMRRHRAQALDHPPTTDRPLEGPFDDSEIDF